MPRITPVRLGIVGLGMGLHHLKAAVCLPEVEVVAIADPSEERYQRLCGQELPGIRRGQRAVSDMRRFDDYKSLVKSGEVEAVSLALPTGMHYQASAWCLRNGVDVLCEKPPTVRSSQMLRLARLVEELGRTYAFVRQQRFTPAKFRARELVAGGMLGRVTHAESHWLRSRNIPWRQGWGVNAAAGGGVLLDLGIHSIDDAWFCLGNPQPEEVFCTMHCNFAHLAEERSDLRMAYDADDHTVAMIRFSGGITLNTSVSFAGNRTKAADLLRDDGQPIANSEWLELGIYGNRAGIDVGSGRLISHHRDGVTVSDLLIPQRLQKMQTQFHGLISDFAQAIRAGRPPLNDARQAVDLMRMLDAMKKSATSGRSVSLKPSL